MSATIWQIVQGQDSEKRVVEVPTHSKLSPAQKSAFAGSIYNGIASSILLDKEYDEATIDATDQFDLHVGGKRIATFGPDVRSILLSGVREDVELVWLGDENMRIYMTYHNLIN